MHVIIAGGGTGGHVFPALAVAERFVQKGCEVTFIGTKDGLESELIPKNGFKMEFVSSGKWMGQNILKKIFTVFKILAASLGARKLLKRLAPDIVVGVGGYASMPVLIAAKLSGIPIFLMEQNSVPGSVNKLFGRFADKIFLTFPESRLYFKPGKIMTTGNPVRQKIIESAKELPSTDDKFVVLCFGGSQGARTINEAMLSSLKYLVSQKSGMKLIHITGTNIDIDMVKDIYSKEGFDAEVYSFRDDIEKYYVKAHLVICRAGASSVTDLMVSGRPAVLIPYPYHSDHQQEKNAEYVEKNGGAIVVLDKDFDGKKAADIISDFMKDPEKLIQMGEAMKKMARPEAAYEIVNECMKKTGQKDETDVRKI